MHSSLAYHILFLIRSGQWKVLVKKIALLFEGHFRKSLLPAVTLQDRRPSLWPCLYIHSIVSMALSTSAFSNMGLSHLVKCMETTVGEVVMSNLKPSHEKKRKLKKCIVEDCKSGARSKGLCKAHGGGKRCGYGGCGLSDQGGGFCIRHGGGKRCQHAGCDKSAQSRKYCKAHGGGVRCDIEGCMKSSQGGGKCRAHGGGPRFHKTHSCFSETDSNSSSGCETAPTFAPAHTTKNITSTHGSSSNGYNPSLSLTVIEKIQFKSFQALSSSSSSTSSTCHHHHHHHPSSHGTTPQLLGGLPSVLKPLKTPLESLPRKSEILPPLAVAMNLKRTSAKESNLPRPDGNKLEVNMCVYPKCPHPVNRMGFCTFHSSQFFCQVDGCLEKRVRGSTLCPTHGATANLAKCLLKFTHQ